MPANSLPPTPRQHAYLKALAQRTGTTFITPRSRAQASREITRLKAITDTGFTFAELQAEEQARELHGDPPLQYATVVHADEISGYGSTCTWSQRR